MATEMPEPPQTQSMSIIDNVRKGPGIFLVLSDRETVLAGKERVQEAVLGIHDNGG